MVMATIPLLTALSTALGEGQLEARGGTASLPELQTPKYLWENFALKMRTRDFIAFSRWKASLSNLRLSGGSCSPHIFSGAVESPLGA